jgi:hypothetical protein
VNRVLESETRTLFAHDVWAAVCDLLPIAGVVGIGAKRQGTGYSVVVDVNVAKR